MTSRRSHWPCLKASRCRRRTVLRPRPAYRVSTVSRRQMSITTSHDPSPAVGDITRTVSCRRSCWLAVDGTTHAYTPPLFSSTLSNDVWLVVGRSLPGTSVLVVSDAPFALSRDRPATIVASASNSWPYYPRSLWFPLSSHRCVLCYRAFQSVASTSRDCSGNRLLSDRLGVATYKFRACAGLYRGRLQR